MFSKITEVTNALEDLLKTNSDILGVNFVGFNDDMVPEYPGLVIVPGPIDRQVHGTRQFRLDFTAAIFVYHADMTITHAERTREDIDLANGIVEFLHSEENRHLGVDGDGNSNLVFSFIDNEAPGILSNQKGRIVVGTRLGWTGFSVVPMP